jgi:hypothetical protein
MPSKSLNFFVRCLSILSKSFNFFAQCLSILSKSFNFFVQCWSIMSKTFNYFVQCLSNELRKTSKANRSGTIKFRPNQGSMLWSQFCPIFGEKIAFFSKTNVMIKNLQKLAVVRAKNANILANFFGEIF